MYTAILWLYYTDPVKLELPTYNGIMCLAAWINMILGEPSFHLQFQLLTWDCQYIASITFALGIPTQTIGSHIFTIYLASLASYAAMQSIQSLKATQVMRAPWLLHGILNTSGGLIKRLFFSCHHHRRWIVSVFILAATYVAVHNILAIVFPWLKFSASRG